MMLTYLYSKFIKKYLRGKCIFRSRIDKKSYIYAGTLFHASSLGRYSYVGYDCEIINTVIGSFCSIANGVVIGGAMHPLKYVSTSPVFCEIGGGTNLHLGNLKFCKEKKTNIGNDVWIGSKAIVIQGVNIGNGAVVGAGAIVTKDVPPYAIVAGSPAKIIKYRFDENTINKLQKSKWWNFDDKELKTYSNVMDNVDEFLREIRNAKTKLN